MKRRVLTSLIACSGLTLLGFGLVAAVPPPPSSGLSKVYPIGSLPLGKSYAEWAASANKWGLELPVGDCSAGGTPPGHPYLECPNFDVTEGQSGRVWYLAGAFGAGPQVVRSGSISKGTSLVATLASTEASDLEDPLGGFYGATEAEQRAITQYFVDHIPVGSLFCSIDGVAVEDLGSYRVSAPQIDVQVPTPWIFGATGGAGTSVLDGYFVVIKPLTAGPHVVRFGGAFHFAIADGDPFDADFGIDMVYNLNVTP